MQKLSNFYPILICMLLLLFQSCYLKTAHFWAFDHGRYFKYSFKINKHCSCEFLLEEGLKGKYYTFKDSSLIFINNNIPPKTLPKEVIAKYGRQVGIRFLGTDTLTLKGVDSIGRFWEIRKNKYAVYSYWNVPPNRKAEFDAIFDSMKIKEDKKYSFNKVDAIRKIPRAEVVSYKCKTF